MKTINREKLKILTALAFIVLVAVVGYGSLKKIIVRGEGNVGSCEITSGSSIPANCEGKDVTITGNNVEILADLVRVKQSAKLEERTACNDPNDAACDSHRYFNSLTVQNNARLTHSGLTVADQDVNPNNRSASVAEQATGKTRWKKVDIETAKGITVSIGGKIDVTGRGYPGGESGSSGNLSECPNKDAVIFDGYGPGQGKWSEGNGEGHEAIASGAGFGGKGGVGLNPDSGQSINGGSAYSNIGSYPYAALEFGSGGGGAYSHYWAGAFEGNKWACANGGAGGGRIHLRAAENIELKDTGAVIHANGSDDDYYASTNNRASGGAGAGGSIWLEAKKIITPEVGSEVATEMNAEGGGDARSSKVMWAENGEILVTDANAKLTNIFASGGNGGGGGSGGRIILGTSTTTPGTPGGPGSTTYTTNKRKIRVEVSWRDASNPNPVALSTILIGLTKTVTTPVAGSTPTSGSGGAPTNLYTPSTTSARVYTAGAASAYSLCVRKQNLVGYCFNSGLVKVVDLVADQNYIYANVAKSGFFGGVMEVHEVYRYDRSDINKAPVKLNLPSQAAPDIAVSAEHIYRMSFSDKMFCRYKKSDNLVDGCMSQDEWKKFPNVPGTPGTSSFDKHDLDYDWKNQVLYVAESKWGNVGFLAKVEIDKNGKWEIKKKVESGGSGWSSQYAASARVVSDGDSVYTANSDWIVRRDTNLSFKAAIDNDDDLKGDKDLAVDTHNLYVFAFDKNFLAKLGKGLTWNGNKVNDDWNSLIAAYKEQ